MGRSLDEHLEHILTDVVPERGAAQDGIDESYVTEIEARAQPPHLVRGLEQWNAGRFYEQHETLEWLWRATPDPVRDALKGIIQSGVGAYHVLKNNRRGALGKWTGAIGYLEPFEGTHPYGIDIGHLRRQVLQLREVLLDTESPQWEEFHERVRAMEVRWVPNPAEPAVTEVLRRLDRAWQDSPRSIEAAIEDLTEEEAVWQPAPELPSVRAVLRAVGVRKAMAVDRCFGEGSLVEEEIGVPERWRKFERWLTEEHEAFREPVGFLHDEDLEEIHSIVPGSPLLKDLIEETIEADFYDAGRLRMLRALWSARR